MTPSNVEKVVSYFKQHRFQWVDGMRIAKFAGAYAWRSRIAEARILYDLPIENRVIRRKGKPTVSEYRLGRRRAA